MQAALITLEEFIYQRQKDFPYASGELSGLLRDISLASKIIQRDLSKAGLVDHILGKTGTVNIQGEEVKKLDDFANNMLIQCLQTSGECCGVASEEEDTFISFHEKNRHQKSKYVVLFDPLDGSSNIDVGAPVGTIFSIYKRVSPIGGPCTDADFLQKGTEQVAAGYVMYGSSTMLFYTTGGGVNGFTLDPSIGEFCLSHPDVKTPNTEKTYSCNQGNYHSFENGVKEFINYCQSSEGKKPFSLRYIGSMVADFHRNMIKGGIFMYPNTADAPNGKLRLMYECNPLAFLQEQAGGKADWGGGRILEIQPSELHTRTAVFIGGESLVNRLLENLK